jgi:hypothetical protein
MDTHHDDIRTAIRARYGTVETVASRLRPRPLLRESIPHSGQHLVLRRDRHHDT